MKAKSLARSYLMNTQGVLLKNKFDTVTGNFDGEFTLNAQINAPTIVYRSLEYYYQSGSTFSVTDESGNVLSESDYVVSNPATNYLGIQITNQSYHG